MRTAILSLSFILLGLTASPLFSQTIATTTDGFYALRLDGSVIGYGPNIPLQIVEIGDFVKLTSGGQFHFGIKADGSLWKWTHQTSPEQIGTESWLRVSAGPIHTLAIRTDSTLWAWGDGADGKLGNGSTIGSSDPIQIGTDKWIDVAAGGRHSMGIQADGRLYTWGNNTFGQLGSNSSNRTTPGIVGDQLWLSIRAGDGHSAAIRSDSTLWMWGRGSSGQLGNNSISSRNTNPIQIGTGRFISVSAGGFHTHAITELGTVLAFGSNSSGQLGDGISGLNATTPTLAHQGTVVEVSAGSSRSLIRLENGAVAIAGSYNNQIIRVFQTLFSGVATPPNSPQNLILSGCSVGFRVRWAQPDQVDLTGITGYRVELKSSDGDWGSAKTLTASEQETYFTNLDKNMSYQVRVFAINLDGESAPLESVPTTPGQWPMSSCSGEPAAEWLNAGSLQNFFMSIGSEREHGFVASQQYGLRWPAINPFQDAQVAKGLWIGAKNVDSAPLRVVHVGPRVSGANEFIPVSHQKISRHTPTYVTVDGNQSTQIPRNVSAVDPNLISDQLIETVVDTKFGIRMTRRVHQWANEDIDNIHLYEYLFENVSDERRDDVRILWLSKYAPVRQTRYVIGNATGWGINTMIDRVGDDVGPDYGAEPGIRGHLAWHGYYPFNVPYNNIGAPIFSSSISNGFVEAWDQTGRLGAPHFIGNVVLHAPAGPGQTMDSPLQPTTLTEIGSDDNLMLSNDYFNTPKNQNEYAIIMEAGRTQRHAYLVEPSGLSGFIASTGDPARGTSGGWSAATSVGPYTLEPGQSVRIVMAEAVNGIDRATAETTGAAFKNGEISALQKNQVVFQGLDSLIQTLNRAKVLSSNLGQIPRTPPHPSAFHIRSEELRVELSWELAASSNSEVTGFEIWRTGTRVDSVYRKIATLPSNARNFNDFDVQLSGNYYYHIITVGSNGLKSNRYATQSYTSVKPLQGTSIDDRISTLPYNTHLRDAYPNPFNPTATIGFDLATSANIRLSVYDVLGREVAILTEGSFIAGTHRVTFDGRSLASGVYLIRLSTPTGAHIKRVTLLK